MRHKTVDLDTFLEGLPEETAAKARAAAARIDELEHAAERIGASDRRFLILFVLAGVFGIGGAVFALGGFNMLKGGEATALEFLVLAMAGAFPLLILIYSLRMKERTKIDHEKFQIIETYFLPYGAIYLPPGPDRRTGLVAISPSTHPWRKADPNSKKRAGWYW